MLTSIYQQKSEKCSLKKIYNMKHIVQKKNKTRFTECMKPQGSIKYEGLVFNFSIRNYLQIFINNIIDKLWNQ